jgi:putative ABC transport system substrate-binding protein
VDRRRFLLTSLAGALAVPLTAGAQQAGKVPRIGYLHIAPRAGPFAQAFEQKLRELGYVEGKNVAIEFRTAEGRFERLPDLASELVGLKVDLPVRFP